MPQVERDRVDAQEHLTCHLAVAEPFRRQVRNAPFGLGQALPAKGWLSPARLAPVPYPGPGGPQQRADPGRAVRGT